MYIDVQADGLGGYTSPGGRADSTVILEKSETQHVHKNYTPGCHPQTGNEEDQPTMFEVETVRPRVTGRNSIELVEDQLEYNRRKVNATIKSKKNFGIEVIARGASETPTSSSTMVESSRLQLTTVGSDMTESSLGYWTPNLTESSVTHDTR